VPTTTRQRWLLIGLCLLVLSGLVFSGGLHELTHAHEAQQQDCGVCALVCAPAPQLELVLEAPRAQLARALRLRARVLESEPQADAYPRGPPRV